MKKIAKMVLMAGVTTVAFACGSNDTSNSKENVDTSDSSSTGDLDSDSGTVISADSDTQSVISSEPGVAGVQEMALETPPGNAVYLDPDNESDTSQDGSLAHPYSTFDTVHITGDTTYAVKRGTTMRLGELILTSGVTIMSYGDATGERPVLQSTVAPPAGTNQHAIVSGWTGISNVTLRDFVIECSDATSCIRFGGTDLSNANLNIVNVKTEGGVWGIRVFGTDGITVLNTEVSHTYDDGMFMQANENIEIGNCHVHDVNLNWQPPTTPEEDAGGDAIQFDSCNHWHVHHCVLDRTNSGNKFCFISNNADQTDGVLEYNHMAGPLPVNGGASVYFHNGDGLIVRYNTILAPAASAVYTHSTNVQLYGNIIAGVDSGVYTSASSRVYNNTFYNTGNGVSGGDVTVQNNIFVMQAGASPFGGVATLTESNNLIVNAAATANSVVGDPAFINAENNDFHLGSTSDAIDAGTDVGLIHDIFGTLIPVGNAPDIGAIEQTQD